MQFMDGPLLHFWTYRVYHSKLLEIILPHIGILVSASFTVFKLYPQYWLNVSKFDEGPCEHVFEEA